VDPVRSFLPVRCDIFRDNQVRAFLAPLADLAAERDFAAIVVAHTRKSAARYADDLILESRAFLAFASAVHLFFKDEDDPTEARRFFLPGKNNFTKARPGLAISVKDSIFKIDEESVPRIEWEAQPLPSWLTADSLASPPPLSSEERCGRPPEQLAEARELLRKALGDGPQPAKQLLRLAREAGISRGTLMQAKAELNVASVFDPSAKGLALANAAAERNSLRGQDSLVKNICFTIHMAVDSLRKRIFGLWGRVQKMESRKTLSFLGKEEESPKNPPNTRIFGLPPGGLYVCQC